MSGSLTRAAFVFLWILIFAATAGAAPFAGFLWQKTVGGSSFETIRALEPLADGGFIAAGETTSRDGDIQDQTGKGDALVIRFASDGSVVWHKCFGDVEVDRAWSVQPTADGGFIVSGETRYQADGYGYHGSLDAWVFKLTADGTMEWQTCIGGTAEEGATAIRQTSDGGYAVVGYTTSYDEYFESNNGATDAWVAKLDADGTVVWLSCLGDVVDDLAYDLELTSDGHFIVAGTSVAPINDPEDASIGLGNFFIAKIDQTGAVVWANTFGGLNDDQAYDVTVLSDGSFLLTGFARSHTGEVTGHFGSADVWVVKVTAAGDLEWARCYGGVSDDIGYQARERSDGTLLIAAATQSKDNQVENSHNNWDVWLLVIDRTGALLKAQVLGGRHEDVAHAALETADGAFVFGGHGSRTGAGDVSSGHASPDCWLGKVRW